MMTQATAPSLAGRKTFSRPRLAASRFHSGLALALPLTLLLLAAAPAARAQAPIATVRVSTAPLQRLIPADFTGLSLEVSAAGQGLPEHLKATAVKSSATSAFTSADIVYALGHPGAPNTAYFQFMRNLGHELLRLGGNSQDNVCWDPTHAPHPDQCKGTLNSADLRLWAHTARATGWHLTIGLNLKQNAPAWMLNEVRQGIARDIPASNITALEIGNEPVLFPRDGARPAPYGAAQQAADFNGYAAALQADPLGRRYKLTGPDNFGWESGPDLGQWLDAVGPDRLAFATAHSYARTVCGNRIVTLHDLLGEDLAQHWQRATEHWVQAAAQRGIPLAVDETNSASCGGMPGVSNAFASTLWGLDWMFVAARSGARSIEFHTSYRTGGSAYNPVDTYGRQDAKGHWHYTNIAEPLYYGMYLFQQEAAGRNLLGAVTETEANIKAYAVSRCNACSVNVILLNKDEKAAGPVRVEVSGTFDSAQALLVSAPSLNALAPAVRYGGAQFNAQGKLGTPKWTDVPRNQDGSYTVTLPNAAVVVLALHHTGSSSPSL